MQCRPMNGPGPISCTRRSPLPHLRRVPRDSRRAAVRHRLRRSSTAPALRPSHRGVGPGVAGPKQQARWARPSDYGSRLPALPGRPRTSVAIRRCGVRQPLPVAVGGCPVRQRCVAGIVDRAVPGRGLHAGASRLAGFPVAPADRPGDDGLARPQRGTLVRRASLRDGGRLALRGPHPCHPARPRAPERADGCGGPRSRGRRAFDRHPARRSVRVRDAVDACGAGGAGSGARRPSRG